MKHHNSNCRTSSLARLARDLYSYSSVLYVGARTDRFDYGDAFRNNGYLIDVLEIWPPNVEYLKTLGFLNQVIEGDVRTFECKKGWYDCIFWWHGPEHIEESQLEETVKRLEFAAKELVVLGCPWGNYPQNALYGNPNECHVSALDYPIFEKIGYDVECLGTKDVPGSGLVAVKHLGWKKLAKDEEKRYNV